jgi:putative transposase
MKKSKSKSTENFSEEFDYSSFEKQALAGLYAGKDLLGSDGILKDIIQRIVGAAMAGEMTSHLAKEKEEGAPANRRNGVKTKKIKTTVGEVPIEYSRDRAGTFEPILIKKWDRNLHTGFDSQILELYANGNSIIDIQSYILKMYNAELSSGQISAITEQVWEEVQQWKSRVLCSFYVLIYLDAINFKIRENGKVVNKAIYTVYGINAYGERDILDLHIGASESEGAKEWGRLLEKIKERGVEDVLFFAVDGLTGFKEAIEAVYPLSIVQRCIVHMVRTSLTFVADKDYKPLCKDLRTIYTADSLDGAEVALNQFAQKWDNKYPEISKKWRTNWEELTAFLSYNEAIRRLIYTTNAVEGLHRKMRKVTKTKGAFPNDKALLKLLYLNLIRDPKSWKRKVFKWSEVSRGLTREFGERFTK